MSDLSEMGAREKILNAAEKVFAELGFEGASLRHIVQEADVNLATVYYYFGSKEGLVKAVFSRLFDPIIKEQLEGLDRLRQRKGALTVEGVLEAMLAPSINQKQARAILGNEIPAKLVGRITTDPNPKTQELIRLQYKEVRQQYVASFRKALPKMAQEDLLWRWEFIWGALASILGSPGRLNYAAEFLGRPLNAKKLLPQMIACFAAGLRAPGPGAKI